MSFEKQNQEEITEKAFDLGSALGDLVLDVRPDVLAQAINMMSVNTRETLIKAVEESKKN